MARAYSQISTPMSRLYTISGRQDAQDFNQEVIKKSVSTFQEDLLRILIGPLAQTLLAKTGSEGEIHIFKSVLSTVRCDEFCHFEALKSIKS